MLYLTTAYATMKNKSNLKLMYTEFRKRERETRESIDMKPTKTRKSIFLFTIFRRKKQRVHGIFSSQKAVQYKRALNIS